MWIVPVRIMNGNISAHAVCNKLLRNVRARERNLFLAIQLNRQRNDDLPRKPAVLCLLGRLNSVP